MAELRRAHVRRRDEVEQPSQVLRRLARTRSAVEGGAACGRLCRELLEDLCRIRGPVSRISDSLWGKRIVLGHPLMSPQTALFINSLFAIFPSGWVHGEILPPGVLVSPAGGPARAQNRESGEQQNLLVVSGVGGGVD